MNDQATAERIGKIISKIPKNARALLLTEDEADLRALCYNYLVGDTAKKIEIRRWMSLQIDIAATLAASWGKMGDQVTGAAGVTPARASDRQRRWTALHDAYHHVLWQLCR